MSSENNNSDPNPFTQGPNYTQIVQGSNRDLFSGNPTQWLETLPSRYQDLRPIGQGGMGQVYLATNVGETGLGTRQVAIKLVLSELSANPQAYERFVQEVHIAEEFDHESIVQVFTHGETTQGVPYLVAIGKTSRKRYVWFFASHWPRGLPIAMRMWTRCIKR